MKIAYLIDRDAVGGGMTYIRRKIAEHPGDQCRVFTSDRGECTAARMNEWGAEIVHVNHLKALLQLFRNPFVKPRGRVVFTVHGIHLRKYDFLPKTPANRIKRLGRLLLERWLYGKCDGLVALTDTDAGDIRRLYGTRTPVSVEPNTIDASCLRGPEGALRFAKGEFAFLCIARFDFQKGQDVLIKAAALVADELRAKGRRILFIGGGPTEAAMRRLATRLSVDDLLEFAGEIPDAGRYMECANVLVSPSRWEGMPYLLLEARARGVHVVASDCPGNRDLICDGRYGRLFPVEDSRALSFILSGPIPASAHCRDEDAGIPDKKSNLTLAHPQPI